MQEEEYFNLSTASQYLGVSLATLRDKIRRGLLHIAENRVDARERLIAKSELDLLKKPELKNATQATVKIAPELLAELNYRAALPESEDLSEAASDVRIEELLNRLEREVAQLSSTLPAAVSVK